MRTVPVRRVEALALIGIMLVAAGLRLSWPTISEFKLDEAQIAHLAQDIAAGRSFPLRGTPSSTGLPLPPLGLYLYALPFLLSKNPLAAVVFTGLWNVAGVALCWWVGRRYWGRAAGLLAALILASNPWAVFYSRKIWEPNLLPSLSLLYILTALQAFVDRRPWALVAHLIVAALILLVYYAGLVLLPVTGILLVVYRRRIQRRAVLAGIGLGVVAALPFALHLWRNWDTIRVTVAKLAAQPGHVDAQALRAWWILASGSQIHALAGFPAYQAFLGSLPAVLAQVPWLIGAAAVAGVLYCTARACVAIVRVWLGMDPLVPIRMLEVQAGGIVALCALAPLLVFTYHATPVYLHYLTASFAPLALASGILVQVLMELHRRWGLSAGLGLAAVNLAQIATVLTLVGFLGDQATPGGHGMPLRYPLHVARVARALGAPIVVLGPGDNPGVAEWPAVFEAILQGTPHRYVDGTQTALFPAAPAALLVAPGADAAERVYALAATPPLRRIPTRAGEAPFYVGRLDEQPALALRPIAGAPTLANGIEWVGYRVSEAPAPGGRFAWWVAWRVARPPPQRHVGYHIYNHLLDVSGIRWAQVDSHTVPTADWAVGDLVVQVFEMQLPPEAPRGPYRMRLGMYNYPDLRVQPVLDIAGNPQADDIVVGPLEP